MYTFREMCRKLRNICQELYTHIAFLSIFSIVLISYLYVEFKCNSHWKDWQDWKDQLHNIDLERCAMIVTFVVFMVVFIWLIIPMNEPSFNMWEQRFQLEMQKRNADIDRDRVIPTRMRLRGWRAWYWQMTTCSRRLKICKKMHANCSFPTKRKSTCRLRISASSQY